MKIVLAALFVAAALVQAAPTPAASGYEIVKDYNYPKQVIGGPFDTLSACTSFMSANQMYAPIHCTYVSY